MSTGERTTDERNLRLQAEEPMRDALNRVDDILARLSTFQGFVASALAIDGEQAFIEHSLETVVETYETELAAFLIAEGDGGEARLVGSFGVDGIDDLPVVDVTDIETNHAGFLGEAHAPSALSKMLGLQEGIYSPFKGKERQFGGLIVTGNTMEGVGVYQTPVEDHLSLFTLLCAQIGALWANLFLMEEIRVRTEKRKQAIHALAQARKEAEVANQAKGDFLANVSHELRTPLNHIMGFIDLVLASELGATQKGFLQKARSSSDDLLTVIKNVISFSQMEKGELSIEEGNFWLDDVCQDLAASFAEQIKKKGLRLRFAPDDTVPMGLVGDAERLTEVFTNLLDNAVKFTDSGDVTVQRELLEQDDDQVMIRFSVSDTGIGIPEEKMSVIFDPFTQGEASATRSHGGTGVGLAICKKLVSLMGGEIWAESTPDEGSRFYFTARFTASKDAKPKERPVPADVNLDDAVASDDGTGAAPVAQEGGQELDAGAVRPLLVKLSELLDADLTEAMGLLEELKPRFEGTDLWGAFSQLSEHVAGFDTDSAMSSLKEIAGKLGIAFRASDPV